MNNKKVSIVIPVYNVENYLTKTIKSCIEQTHKNIEIIIIDDGSKDNSPKIIDNYLNLDNRIIAKHIKNQGVSHARNLGISLATGDYIVFLDGDDYLSKTFVEYMLSLVNINNSEFCYSYNCFTNANQSFDENVKKLTNSESCSVLLSQKIEVGCWNKIYNLKFLKNNNIKFDEELYYGEGLDFILCCSSKANSVTVGCKAEYFYRKNNFDSATTSFNPKKFKNGENSLYKIFTYLDKNDKRVINEWKSHYCLFCMNAMMSIINNDYKNFKSDFKHWRKNYNKNLFSALINKNLLLKRKAKMILFLVFPKLISKREFTKRINQAKESV